jgi:hypothetical protein
VLAGEATGDGRNRHGALGDEQASSLTEARDHIVTVTLVAQPIQGRRARHAAPTVRTL